MRTFMNDRMNEKLKSRWPIRGTIHIYGGKEMKTFILEIMNTGENLGDHISMTRTRTSSSLLQLDEYFVW